MEVTLRSTGLSLISDLLGFRDSKATLVGERHVTTDGQSDWYMDTADSDYFVVDGECANGKNEQG